MTQPSRPPDSPLGQSLGRIPSGLYVLTLQFEGRSTGMLASWVQQAAFEPPMLTVAVARHRYVADWLAATRRLTLNQIAAGQKSLIRHFGRGFAPDAPAFDGIELRSPGGQCGPVLAAALAYLDAEVVGEMSSGDHRLFLAQVLDGALIQTAAEPLLHVRHNGFHY